MRILVLVAPLVLLTGCEACNYPFSVESEGRVVLSLGAVDATCNATGSETRQNGDVVTYTHATSGTDCSLGATWAGQLLDMAQVRADTEEELAAQGLDPATIDVDIVTLTPTVQAVSLRDDDSDSPIDITIPGLQRYTGAISVEGDADIIKAAFDGTGSPTEPTVTVKSSTRLAELANTAYDDETSLAASGVADVNVALDQIQPIVDAVEPSLVIDFKLVVEGTAALGGG